MAKYLIPFVLFALAIVSFTSTGLACWYGFIYSFVFVPILEGFFPADETNLDADAEMVAKNNKRFDYILYLAFAMQFICLWIFLHSFQEPNLNAFDVMGRILVMGLLCGSFGINLAHELGHRSSSFEQFLAQSLLLTSLYMHFFIEHNKGHHTHVATPDDPSSAKYKQSVYAFLVQTFIGTYMSALQISQKDLAKTNASFWSIKNEMLVFQCIQISFVCAIGFFFGWQVCAYFVAAAVMGMLLLETVNYIEHYGLSRQKNENDRFERVQAFHSWNSNHFMGRMMLFELSRHSDHHYQAARKYQVLRHQENAPQMPTGYPGMIILALIPPVWFPLMDKQMRKYKLIGANGFN